MTSKAMFRDISIQKHKENKREVLVVFSLA